MTNYGPDSATNVVVEDHLPAGLRYYDHSGLSQGSYAKGDGTGGRWTVGTLAKARSATLNLKLKVLSAGTHVANADATASQAIPTRTTTATS